MTKELLLTQGFITVIDDEDYPLLSQWKWRYTPRGRMVAQNPRGYLAKVWQEVYR